MKNLEITGRMVVESLYEIQNIIRKYHTTIDVEETYIEKNKLYPGIAVSDPLKIGYFTKSGISKLKEKCGLITLPEDRQRFGIMTKPGKFFRAICPDLSDSTVQKMVSDYLALVKKLVPCISESKFELTKDIKFWYHEDNYCNSSGSLGSSCMSGDEEQDYIDFYSHYDTSLLILRSGGKIKGRALIWHSVDFAGLGTFDFMDRIYVNSDNDISLFIDYANEHNMVHKTNQNYHSKRAFIHKGNSFTSEIRIRCQESFDIEDMQYPYLDTMSWMDADGDLYNTSNTYELTNTNGYYSDNSGHICEHCGDRIDEGYGTYIDDFGYICEDCLDDRYSYCDFCETYVDREYSVWVESDNTCCCDRCFSDHFVYCDKCETIIRSDESIECMSTGVDLCEDCFHETHISCEECGEWSHVDDITDIENHGPVCSICLDDNFTECSECGEYIKNDDCHNDDDNSYCEGCFSENFSECDECGETFHNDSLEDGLCSDCVEAIEEQEQMEETE